MELSANHWMVTGHQQSFTQNLGIGVGRHSKKRSVVMTRCLLFQLHKLTVEDNLKQFLVFPRALYSSQGDYCILEVIHS